MTLRPHFWLPEKTSHGETLRCANCRHYDPDKYPDRCGRANWICGIWQEAEEQQIDLFSKVEK
jgi:hypothetical protein